MPLDRLISHAVCRMPRMLQRTLMGGGKGVISGEGVAGDV